MDLENVSSTEADGDSFWSDMYSAATSADGMRAENAGQDINSLVGCCRACNERKGGRTPEQAGMRLKGHVKSPRGILLDKLHALSATPQ